MHRKEDIGEVELATISFGQSFQITPIRLATTVSALINGGYMVTPHIGVQVENKEGEITKDFSYPRTANIVSGDTSATLPFGFSIPNSMLFKNACIVDFPASFSP